MLELIGNSLGIDFFLGAIRVSTVLVFAALACLYAERAGVLNIAVEGIMLVGAFAATAGAVYSGSLWAGVAASILVGALMGLFVGFLTISLGANQIVVGIMFNMLAIGLTSFLLRILFPSIGTDPTRTPPFTALHIPGLSDIPFLGPILFGQQPLVYVAFALVPVSAFLLFKTWPGLVLRSTGESARTVDAAGINVYGVRYISLTISGLLSGLAGAYLTLGWVHVFTDNLTMGRGFIALAALYFGGWKPFGALVGCLIFGAGEALQMRLQLAGLRIPLQWIQMLPYVLTILALVGITGRSIPPAESAKTFLKD